MINPEFHKLIGQRQLTVCKLAKLATCGRAHLVQVLVGTRQGKYTWDRLARVLTHEEYELAKTFADGRAAEIAKAKAKISDSEIAQQ